MIIYIILVPIIAVVAGIVLAARSQKAEGVTYGKLDKAGRITNIVLIPVYVALTLFSVAVSFFTHPGHSGLLGILGWIVTIIIDSAPLSCGLGLGFSVALRKQGKHKLSFAVQFAGIAGVGLALLLFVTLYGNLLGSIN